MKIDINGIQDFWEKPLSKQLDSARDPSNNDLDASLLVTYASLIDKAAQIPDADSKAVPEAQELLLSGQLESAENIRAAAENIVEFGI
ncbi:MAG: hypothetical protein ACYS76_00060 [Planctomycetota bacterium]|jgi:hypothetical protein